MLVEINGGTVISRRSSVKPCMDTNVLPVERNSSPTETATGSTVHTNATLPPGSELPYADIRG